MRIVDYTLEQFDADLQTIFGKKYIDLLIYGSYTLDDFTPYRGDLDFVVILEDDIKDAEIEKVYSLHEHYRNKEYMNLEHQLEGIYYPRNALESIESKFIGCYIGTGRKGWKKIEKLTSNSFDLIQLNTNALAYRKTKNKIHMPTKAEIANCVKHDYEMWINHFDDNDLPSHVIIQWAARVDYYYRYGGIGSKSESCELFLNGDIDYEYIKMCGRIRSPYDVGKIEMMYPSHRECAKRALKYIGKEIGILA